MPNLRWALVAAFMLLSVVVDFSSHILSIASDALLIGVAIFIAWPMIKKS